MARVFINIGLSHVIHKAWVITKKQYINQWYGLQILSLSLSLSLSEFVAFIPEVAKTPVNQSKTFYRSFQLFVLCGSESILLFVFKALTGQASSFIMDLSALPPSSQLVVVWFVPGPMMCRAVLWVCADAYVDVFVF